MTDNQTVKLRIATSQFHVTTSISDNLKCIIEHTHLAIKANANIVHFPELSLSGYETNIKNINWEALENALAKLRLLAKEANINIVFGAHCKHGDKPPYNCTYLITSTGELAGKYIKSRLYSKENNNFSAVDNLFTYKIKGVQCGFLICFDSNFPELFRSYRKLGVKLLFLSYYNAKSSKPKNNMDVLMRSQFITRATDNLMYISGSNSSAKYSRMPSSFVAPDGSINSMKRHIPGVLVSEYPKINLGWIYDNTKY